MIYIEFILNQNGDWMETHFDDLDLAIEFFERDKRNKKYVSVLLEDKEGRLIAR